MDFTNIIIAVVTLIIIGALLGLLLAVADKYLTVQVDERIEKVTSMLPGYNCGSCGYPGCHGFATGLINGEIALVSGCKPSKTEQREKIAEYINATPDSEGNILVVKPY